MPVLGIRTFMLERGAGEVWKTAEEQKSINTEKLIEVDLASTEAVRVWACEP